MNVYLANSKDTSIRKNSSSGGAVKSILLDLIDQNRVDDVIITQMVNGDVKTIITNNKDEICNNTNSIYQPTNPLTALPTLDANKKYCIVCLPCHTSTLRRLQSYGIGLQITFVISL